MRKYYVCDKGYNEQAEWDPGCWIDVECPDNNDFDFLTGEVGIPEDFLTDSVDIDERPRIDREDKWTLTILRIPVQTPEGDTPYTTVPIAVITDESLIVTICYHKNDIISNFIAHTRHKAITTPNRPDFILMIIYWACSLFLKYLKEINDEVTRNEKTLEVSVRDRELLRMMQLEKSLVFFNTSLEGNEVLMMRLKHAYPDNFDFDLYEDVEIEMKQALSTVKIYSDILTASMDAFASIISNNVNQVMKRMTGVTIVLMIPTLIASFYGMNVDIGIGQLSYAFFIIIGASALLTAATYFLLRRIRWF